MAGPLRKRQKMPWTSPPPICILCISVNVQALKMGGATEDMAKEADCGVRTRIFHQCDSSTVKDHSTKWYSANKSSKGEMKTSDLPRRHASEPSPWPRQKSRSRAGLEHTRILHQRDKSTVGIYIYIYVFRRWTNKKFMLSLSKLRDVHLCASTHLSYGKPSRYIGFCKGMVKSMMFVHA